MQPAGLASQKGRPTLSHGDKRLASAPPGKKKGKLAPFQGDP